MRLLILGYIKLAYSYTNNNKDIPLAVEDAEACLISNAFFSEPKFVSNKIVSFYANQASRPGCFLSASRWVINCNI